MILKLMPKQVEQIEDEFYTKGNDCKLCGKRVDPNTGHLLFDFHTRGVEIPVVNVNIVCHDCGFVITDRIKDLKK